MNLDNMLKGFFFLGILTCLIAVPGPASAQSATQAYKYGLHAYTVSASYQVEPGLSPRERLMQATFFLGLGQVAPARVELDAALSQQPDNPDAWLLLLQLDGDPVSILGKNSTPYTVKPDETLLRIAEDFLGSQYLFYALAGYNGLESPNAIQEGQQIRIPRTDLRDARARRKIQASVQKLKNRTMQKKYATKVAAFEQDLKTYPEDPHLQQFGAQVYFEYGKLVYGKGDHNQAAKLLRRAQQLGSQDEELKGMLRKAESRLAVQNVSAKVQKQLKQGQVDAAIEALLNARKQHPSEGRLKSLLVKSYVQKADALLRQGGQEDASLEILRKAQKLDKKNSTVAAKLQKLNKRLQENRQEQLADRLFADGTRYLETSAHLKAYWAFKQAFRHNPDHRQAQEKLGELGPMLSRDLHAKATSVFYQEEEDVDQAICLWEQVLKIDPENRLARAERDRADLADCNVKKLFGEAALCGQRDCTPWVPADLFAENASKSIP